MPKSRTAALTAIAFVLGFGFAMAAHADDMVPPPPGGDMMAPPPADAGAPPPPGMDAGAPPPPGMDAGAPPAPGADAGAPPPPGMDAGAPPPPGGDAMAPPPGDASMIRPIDKIAVGTLANETARIVSPNPGSSFSNTARVASGVTSRGETPVPPVVRIRAKCL